MPGVTHSNIPLSTNVFVNGGPTLGGILADALGLPDVIGVSDADARAILSGRAAELARGNNPNLNEPLEQYRGGQDGGTSPVTGQDGLVAAPGSDMAVGADAQVDSDIETPTSQWIRVKKDVNPKVLPEVWKKAEAFAKSLGRPILMTSGVRTPEYNASIGGSGESVHTKRQAFDVAWETTSVQGRVDMIQRAIDAGFTGIGCYDWGMHMDISTKRNWGPNGSFTGQFAQYKPVLKANGYHVG